MRRHFNFLILLFVSFPLSAADISLQPAQEDRAQQLFREIRCMVCTGESIADSQAAVASDLRANVRLQILNGFDDDVIKAELASKYGDGILMDPPFKSSTYLLWFGPWLILLIGGAAIYFYFRSSKKS